MVQDLKVLYNIGRYIHTHVRPRTHGNNGEKLFLNMAVTILYESIIISVVSLFGYIPRECTEHTDYFTLTFWKIIII